MPCLVGYPGLLSGYSQSLVLEPGSCHGQCAVFTEKVPQVVCDLSEWKAASHADTAGSFLMPKAIARLSFAENNPV